MGLKSVEYERQLRETRAEGYKVMEKERAAISREREQKISQVKVDVTRWIDEEKTRLGTDAESAKASLEKDARAMAQVISRQILRREIDR
jgi:F0F1-type ATP synthase membrane subunit b/b'